MEFIDQKELVKEYLEEAAGLIDEYEDLLLVFERTLGERLDPQSINDVLGLLHTLKGNSGMMGFDSIQTYAHKLEDVFKNVQSGGLPLDAELIEFLLKSVNTLRDAVSNISPRDPADSLDKKEIDKIDDLIAGAESSDAPISASKGPAARVSGSISTRSNLIKVDFERLDNLLNLMGELVIYRTRLEQMEKDFVEAYGEKGKVLELADTSELIAKGIRELHQAVMKIRMLPINRVFMRFPRLVRDLARAKGKEIDIRFEGQDTELDKTVIDEIGEPLMHLIRNSIDHGIEPPREREDSGKPRQSEIRVSAFQESGQIVIKVEDDGRGIDVVKLRERAEAAGLLKAEQMAGQDLTDLIFMPGLSTAETVSEVSGRGMGMDVVRKSLARINGTIAVETVPGYGTSFTIRLPLTLAIVPALRVGVCGEQYAIPVTAVQESVKVRKEDIHKVNDREVMNFRDRLLPVVRLSELFTIPPSNGARDYYVVIVRNHTTEMGLVVDSLLGQQEIVIKNMGDYLGKPPGIAGATVMGDGRVVLIVDVNDSLDLMKVRGQDAGLVEETNA